MKSGSINDGTIPGYIARELLRTDGVGPGHEVGYQYSGEYEQQDRYTKLLYVSDGTLVNWLRDGSIGQFDVVFIDEAHELSSNMELIFALLKYQIDLYPRLRVVIASATADVDRFIEYFGNGDKKKVLVAAPEPCDQQTLYEVFDVPVVEWAECLPDFKDLDDIVDPAKLIRRLPDAVSCIVEAIQNSSGISRLGEPDGDVLVFVPTQRSAESIKAALLKMRSRWASDFEVILSHAKVDREELERFRESEIRASRAAKRNEATSPQRVIVATNYAETSVTFANIHYVIDSGLIMSPVWNPKLCSTNYTVEWHSKAGCKQRRGRVGRTQSGEYFALYSEQAYKDLFKAQTPAELTRRPLDRFILSAKASGISNLESFRWLSYSSNNSEIERSIESLRKRGAIDDDGDITHRGVELGGIGTITVELAECLAMADRFGCAFEVATFLAIVKYGGIEFKGSRRGTEHFLSCRSACKDDLEFYLRIYDIGWKNNGRKNEASNRKKWEINNELKAGILETTRTLREDYLKTLGRKDEKRGERELDLFRLDRVRVIFAKCLQQWMYKSSPEEINQYYPKSKECPCQSAVLIDQNSVCVSKPNIKSFVCFDRTESRNGSVFARHIVATKHSWQRQSEDNSAIGLSILVNGLLSKPRKSRSAVIACPTEDYMQTCKVGDVLEDLCVVRILREDHGSIYRAFAEHKKSGLIIEIVGKGRCQLQPGDIVRAKVNGIDKDIKQIVASQLDLLPATSSSSDIAVRTLVGLHYLSADPAQRALIEKELEGFLSQLRILVKEETVFGDWASEPLRAIEKRFMEKAQAELLAKQKLEYDYKLLLEKCSELLEPGLTEEVVSQKMGLLIENFDGVALKYLIRNAPDEYTVIGARLFGLWHKKQTAKDAKDKTEVKTLECTSSPPESAAHVEPAPRPLTARDRALKWLEEKRKK
ncbi:MAG: hypothetical protein KDB03_05150 [Planctomycetales bacterium]|nr:hypothetical protein [Planctomycetales bacterium]